LSRSGGSGGSGTSDNAAWPDVGNGPGNAEYATPPFASAQAERDMLAWRIAKFRRYDLNLLLSLHALLYTRNVTLARDWLGVTQPAMSSDLRRLRHMFKDELLIRVGREYQLTSLASSLVEPLIHAVAEIERALTWRPSFEPRTDSRSFSIAMSDHVMALTEKTVADLTTAGLLRIANQSARAAKSIPGYRRRTQRFTR